MGWEQRVSEFLGVAFRGFQGVRLGPGVLKTIMPVNMVGLIVLLGGVYALREQPILAVSVAVLVVFALLYINERAYRYAVNHPLPAVLAGAELFQLIHEQMGAKHREIVAEKSAPIAGAGSAALIESKSQ